MEKLQHIKGTPKGYLALTTTCILWGTTWVASKVAVAEIPGLQLVYIRQFIAGSCFLLFFLLVKKLPLPTLKEFKSLLVMSLLMFVMANGLSTWGLKYLPTGLASLIGSLFPLTIVIIEWIFYKKRNVSKLTFLGLLIGIAGVAFVFYQHMFEHHLDNDLILGLSLSIIAIISWSLGVVFLSRHTLKINPYYGMGWQMIMSSVIVFIIAHFTQPVVPLASISHNSWMAVLYLIVAGSIISFIAFIYSLKTLPSAISSLFAYVNPIVAIITASILLDEKLTVTILIGTVITLIGVYLVNYSVRKDQQDVIVEAEI